MGTLHQGHDPPQYCTTRCIALYEPLHIVMELSGPLRAPMLIQPIWSHTRHHAPSTTVPCVRYSGKLPAVPTWQQWYRAARLLQSGTTGTVRHARLPREKISQTYTVDPRSGVTAFHAAFSPHHIQPHFYFLASTSVFCEADLRRRTVELTRDP